MQRPDGASQPPSRPAPGRDLALAGKATNASSVVIRQRRPRRTVVAEQRCLRPPTCATWRGAAWAVWALGCGTIVTATPLNPPPRPLVPRPPESVQFFASEAPGVPHIDVALLEVHQDHGPNRQGLALMVQRLREKAGELGCDAVFIKSRSEHDGDSGTIADLVDHDAQLMLASCIVYKEPPAGAPLAADQPPPTPPDQPPSRSRPKPPPASKTPKPPSTTRFSLKPSGR